jgi:hypothetical protein
MPAPVLYMAVQPVTVVRCSARMPAVATLEPLLLAMQSATRLEK